MRRSLSLLLIALALALPAAAPAPAAAAADQVMVFEAPAELFDDARRERVLDEIRAFGVRRIRQIVVWRNFAPKANARRAPAVDLADPEAYPRGTWDRLDLLFAAAAPRGVEIQLTLTGPVPRWASRGGRDHVTEPDPKAFEAFATAVGRRYGSRVALWSLWNEPNQPQFLKPQYRRGRPASPKIYRRLFLAGRRGLAASGNADDAVLLGETSPIGNENVVEPLDFLRGALCLDSRYRPRGRCAPLDVDGYAHHPYTKRSGPTYRPPDGDDVTIGVLRRLVRALDRAARAKAIPARLPIHLTEFGIQSTPDPIAGVSQARQAEYLAIAERLAYYEPRVAAFSQYLMEDEEPRDSRDPGERYAGFESGLRRSDGRAKPAYDGFRLPLVAVGYGRYAVLWGRVRPAEGATEIELQVRRGRRWRSLGAVATTDSAIWGTRVRHRDRHRYRVRWTAPDGTVHTGATVRAY